MEEEIVISGMNYISVAKINKESFPGILDLAIRRANDVFIWCC